MSGAISSFTLMAVAGRELSAGISTVEIMFFRSLFGLLTITLIILSMKKKQYFQTSNVKGHLLRNSFHFLAQYGWFISLSILPFAQVFAIEFTVPFWTAIIAAIFLKERLTINKVVAIIVAFIGVLFIVQPSLSQVDSASLLMLAAAFCFASAHSCTKMLSKHNNPITIVFYMCLIQFPISAALMTSHWTMPNAVQWLWIIIVSQAALGANFCMTKAMLSSTVTMVVTLDFIRLPVAVIVAWILYQEPFGLLSVFGMALILMALLFNVKPPSFKILCLKKEGR